MAKSYIRRISQAPSSKLTNLGHFRSLSFKIGKLDYVDRQFDMLISIQEAVLIKSTYILILLILLESEMRYSLPCFLMTKILIQNYLSAKE